MADISPLAQMTSSFVSTTSSQDHLQIHPPLVRVNLRLSCGILTCAGTSEPPPVENWRIFRRLVGHDNDVQDLGWSWDSSILVSVGLDSKVVVWSGYTFEKLKTLSNHQSHVKGITFDPANKYFATASDDRTIKIFRFNSPGPNSSAHDQMNNFVLETTITAPFANSPLTTYFRRCSWAPDGMHIAAANAVNGPVSSVAIINRGQWDGDIHLIGHEAPVEVCTFSPRLYGRDPPDRTGDGQLTPHNTVIACGAGDKSLSIWITSNPRPLIITQDLATKSISDLAWSPDGLSLFATSLDGTILAAVFSEGELGYPRSVDENEKSLTKFGTGRKGVGILETTDGLLLEEKSKAREIKGVEGRMGALMGDGHPVQRASNGTAVNGSAASPVNGTNVPISDQAKESEPQIDPNQAKLERLKQRVEITKDGKKRIKPLLVSGAGAAESSLPQSRLVSASAATVLSSDAPQSILDLSKPFDAFPKGGLAALLLGNKRRYIEDDDDGHIEKKLAMTSQNGASPIVVNGPDGLVPAQSALPLAGQQSTPDFIRPAVVNPVISVSQLRLAVPKVRLHIVQGVDNSGNPTESSMPETRSKADLVFEVRNPSGGPLTNRPQDREPARITLSRKDQPVWQDFLPKAVILATGGKDFWATADETGGINVWSPAGRRITSTIILEAQAVILASNGPWLLCITAVGMCYIWNVHSMTSPHPPVSLAPVLDAAVHTMAAHPTNGPSITHARINSAGRVIVAVSNGEGYSYSPTMFAWQKLSEVWWAVGSQYWNTTDSTVGNLRSSSDRSKDTSTVSAGIIPFLERNTTNETLMRGRAYFLQRLIKILLSKEGFEGFEASVSIAHLENRVAAALTLGAKEEFQIYLYMYAKRLGAEGLRGKVEELLRTLLGGLLEENEKPPSRLVTGSEQTWNGDDEMICGWPRKELLKGVVLLLGKHRDLQRAIVPYAQLLGVMDSETEQDTMVS